MTDRLLTTHQIDDLLTVYRRGRDPSRDVDVVRSFDLSHPTRVPQAALESLRARYEQAARQLAQELRVVLGTEVWIDLDGFEQMQFGAWRETLPAPCCGFIVDMHPLEDPAIFVVDHRFAFLAIERSLGGQGDPLEETRDLTATEVEVFRETLEVLIESQVRSWSAYAALEGALRQPIGVPSLLREIAAEDVVLAAAFRVRGGLEGSRIRIALPIAGLEPRLQQAPRHEVTKTEAEECRSRLLEHVREVRLKVSVVLGSLDLRVSDLIGLEEGDVLVLDRHVTSKVELAVEGRPQFRGALFQSGRELVFRIEGGEPEALEEREAEA